MSIEKRYKSFNKDVQKVKGIRETGTIYSYEEALEQVRNGLAEILKDDEVEEKKEVKTKALLRKLKAQREAQVSNVVFGQNIRVRDYTSDEFITSAVEEFVGYSVLHHAFSDPKVSDIFCLGWDKIYVERNGQNEPYPYIFRDAKHYENFIERVLREGGNGVGKVVDNGEHKVVDAEFYGDRILATSKAVTPKDFSITFRKHSESQVTLENIVEQGVLSEEISEFLGTAILGELNIIYAGITGSGKTTTIRALIDHYVTLSNKRMLVVEDTQELAPKNDHTLELISSKNADKKLEVTLHDLIITALRLKPKYIVVGEVRGAEAQAAVESMETGHSTIFTMHGEEPINIINRLVTKYLTAMPSLGIDVVERIIGSAVDYIAIQDDIPDIGRRVSVISEVSYNFETGRVSLKPIFEFDFDTETYKMVGKMNPAKAKRMLRRGVKKNQISQWVEGWS